MLISTHAQMLTSELHDSFSSAFRTSSKFGRQSLENVSFLRQIGHGSTVENNKTQRVLFWTTCTRAVLDLPRWTQTFHIHICAGCCLFATQIISAMPYDPYDLAMGLWGTTSLTVYWFFETIWCHWAVGIFHPRRLVSWGVAIPAIEKELRTR